MLGPSLKLLLVSENTTLGKEIMEPKTDISLWLVPKKQNGKLFWDKGKHLNICYGKSYSHNRY